MEESRVTTLISIPNTEHLLYGRGFLFATSFTPHNSMEDMYAISTAKDEEMGFKEINHGTQSHTTKWQSQDSNLRLTNSKIHILATK